MADTPGVSGDDDLKAVSDESGSVFHDFDCTHNPCRCQEPDGEWFWRYRVDGIEGVVPPFVAELLAEEDGFMLYPEDRGAWSMQHFMQAHKVVGGWTMTRAGRVRVVGNKTVETEPEPTPCGGPSKCMDDLCRNSSTGLCGYSDEDFADDEDDIDDGHWGPCCETGECE